MQSESGLPVRDAPDGAEILDALAQYRVRIQSSVGRQVRAKKTPILSFKPDDVIRAAERIEKILHDRDTLPARPPDPDLEPDQGVATPGAASDGDGEA